MFTWHSSNRQRNGIQCCASWQRLFDSESEGLWCPPRFLPARSPRAHQVVASWPEPEAARARPHLEYGCGMPQRRERKLSTVRLVRKHPRTVPENLRWGAEVERTLFGFVFVRCATHLLRRARPRRTTRPAGPGGAPSQRWMKPPSMWSRNTINFSKPLSLYAFNEWVT